MRKVKIETRFGIEEVEAWETEVPGLVVTPLLSPEKGNNKPIGWTITHEASGFLLSYRFTGKTITEMTELANRMNGVDWTKPSPLIYQNPEPYQEAMRQALPQEAL